MKLILVLLGVLGIILPSLAIASDGTLEQRQKLRDRIFHKYDKYNNPDNATVKLGMALLDLDVDEGTNSIKVHAWLRQTWTDGRLVWDSKETPVDVIRANSDEIWKPDLTLYNSLDLVELQPCGKTNVLIYPHGEVLWVPPCSFQAFCTSLATKDAPTTGAIHECELKFGSWTFDGLTMDLQSYNSDKELDMTDFRNATNSNWDVVGSEIVREEKYYPCCEEPYIALYFKIKIQKKTA